MKTEDDENYLGLFAKMEGLYVDEEYEQIINLKNAYSDGYLLDTSKKNFISFAEMIAVSYIELSMLHKAITVIDKCLNYIVKRKNITKEEREDLSVFYSLKLEALEKQNSTLRQLRAILAYRKNGGKNKEILDRKSELQEIIYNKYVLINKIFLYIIVGIIILSITRLLTINKTFLAPITTLGLLWYLLNYIFHKKIKKIFVSFID